MAKRKHQKRSINTGRKAVINTQIPMGTTMLDILIPVHRRFDLLAQCLDAIPKAAGDTKYRLIIFDNGSPREEADIFYVQRQDPNLKLFRSEHNLGFPKACNIAFNQGSSPLVFFLNSDVILEPDSLPKLIKEFNDPKIGVVGMKLVFPEYTDLPQDQHMRPAGKIQHIGLASNVHGDFIHIFIGWSKDHPKVNAVRDVYAVTGAALMTRRSLFTKKGKFQEIYGLGSWEGIDYCLTVRKMGYNAIVVPEAVGVHHTGATAQKYNLGYPLQENKLVFMQRWARELDHTEINHW